MALGKLVQIGAKANIWREIQQDGVGLVVEDEVEAIGAGSREMRALCSGARGAIRLEARYWLITGLIGGLILCAGFTRRSRCGFACAVRPTRASRRHLGQAAFFLWLPNRRQGEAET
jgi:hypothetical protein